MRWSGQVRSGSASGRNGWYFSNGIFFGLYGLGWHRWHLVAWSGRGRGIGVRKTQEAPGPEAQELRRAPVCGARLHEKEESGRRGHHARVSTNGPRSSTSSPCRIRPRRSTRTAAPPRPGPTTGAKVISTSAPSPAAATAIRNGDADQAQRRRRSPAPRRGSRAAGDRPASRRAPRAPADDGPRGWHVRASTTRSASSLPWLRMISGDARSRPGRARTSSRAS